MRRRPLIRAFEATERSRAMKGGEIRADPLPLLMEPGTRHARGRSDRAPWRRPRGTHEVVEHLFRHHFDEVVAKLGRHPYTRDTSVSYRENLASEVLKRMLESQQLERYEPGAVGAWITQAVYRHRNEADRALTRLSVTEGELDEQPWFLDDDGRTSAAGLDAFQGPSHLEPESAQEAKERDLAGLELRAQLPEELQQLYQLRWEQGLPPRKIRSHFGWSLKQYEKRDSRLKSIVLSAVERSAPDSIVNGRGDGSVCRETRDLLPLVLRRPAALAQEERRRLDAHLLACHSCLVTAREAERLLAAARPLFIPVGPSLGGGVIIGGGLLADAWAKALAVLGVGGTGGAAAVKVAGVAGCVAACVAGGEALLKAPEDSPRSRAEESVAVTKRPPIQRRMPATVRSPRRAPSASVGTPASAKPSMKKTKERRLAPRKSPTAKRRTLRATVAPQRQTPPATSAPQPVPQAPPPAVSEPTKATEFLPEKPPASNNIASSNASSSAAPSPPPPVAASPAAQSRPPAGAEFAGP